MAHVHRATAAGARLVKQKRKQSRLAKTRKTPLRADVVARQQQCLALRLAGWQFADIASELGYADATGPYHAVQAALQTCITESVDDYRAMIIARLDGLLRSLQAGIKRGSPRHVEAALRIEERRAKVMGWIDRPDRHNLNLTIKGIADITKALGEVSESPA